MENTIHEEFVEYEKELTKIINGYVDKYVIEDWDKLLEVLKMNPDIDDAKLDFTDDKKNWVEFMDEEPRYTRLRIWNNERWKTPFDELYMKSQTYCRIKLLGLIAIISEDYSSNCVPDLTTRYDEGLEEFIWSNHYGS